MAQPPASQDSQNVRNFVSQAGFTTGKGGSSTAATTQQQQGRRLLAEVQRVLNPQKLPVSAYYICLQTAVDASSRCPLGTSPSYVECTHLEVCKSWLHIRCRAYQYRATIRALLA